MSLQRVCHSKWAQSRAGLVLLIGGLLRFAACSNLAQDAYTVLGTRLRYLYERRNLRATLFGRKLGDEKYSQGLIATDFGGNVTLAPPRTYGLGLNCSF